MLYDANKSLFLFEGVMIMLFGSIKPVPNYLPKPSFLKRASHLKYIKEIQSTLGFATMGKAANLALATRNAVTDLF